MMDHPLAANRISVILYLLFPLIMGISQAFFNVYYQLLPLSFAITDGLTFGLVLGILGLAIWYVVRYNDPEKSAIAQIIASHMAGAFVFTSIWMLAAGNIASILNHSLLYDTYLKGLIAERAGAGIIFYALLVFTYYIYVYRERNREKQQQELEWQNQVRNAQLSALKFQINPHFLFNSLNSVAALTLTNPGKAHEMVIALSEFMRYSLRNPKDEMVTLTVELRNIGLYLQIEKIRFGNKLQYRFEVDNACSDQLIPNLILQPIFENAIKYGVYESSAPSEIILEAIKRPDCMEIKITNDVDAESVPVKGEGVGLANVSNRLRLLYGSSRLLTTAQNQTQFMVTIEIPDPDREQASRL